MCDMQEWDVLAEEPLDTFLEPDNDSNVPAESDLTDACITWRGDGKYFATVSSVGQGNASAGSMAEPNEVLDQAVCDHIRFVFVQNTLNTPILLST